MREGFEGVYVAVGQVVCLMVYFDQQSPGRRGAKRHVVLLKDSQSVLGVLGDVYCAVSAVEVQELCSHESASSDDVAVADNDPDSLCTAITAPIWI